MPTTTEKLVKIIGELNEVLAELKTGKPVDVLPSNLKKVNKLFYATLPNSFWYMDVRKYPVHKHSAQYVANIGRGTGLHPDFGSPWEGGKIGIPITIASGETEIKQPKFLYQDESDHGDYFIGEVENGSDRHSVVYTSKPSLYELFNYDTFAVTADSGAIWDLSTNKMRPEGWTSADAAGLPIALGLIRYDEIEAGEINHVIRMTVEKTRGCVRPASHHTSGKIWEISPLQPPLGQMFRLKESFDISPFSRTNQIILTAMKVHGVIIADNGGNWFISGCPSDSWDNDDLGILQKVRGESFEAVDISSAWVEDGSYEVVQ